MRKVIITFLVLLVLGGVSVEASWNDIYGEVSKIKPEPLQKGDTIGIVAPGYPVDRGLLNKGIAYLESLGYKVLIGEHALNQNGFLAGDDDKRAQDINEMFANPNVKAIICARGGYGSARIVEKLDYELIQHNPKIFVGYSDISTLLIAIYQRSGLITFHGPMVASDMSKSNFDIYNGFYLKRALTESEPIGEVKNLEGYQKEYFIKEGIGRGELIGGNLTVIVSSLGTDYEIDTKGKILFVEEIGEVSYRIDRLMYQLKLAGKLDELEGLIFGESIACGPKYKGDQTVLEVVQDIVQEYDFPVLYGLTIGHGNYKATLPIGVEAILDSENGLKIIESGVGGIEDMEANE